MQIKTLWAAARRRWYAVVGIVLVAAAATYLVVDAVGPTYEATGAVLLLPPTTTVNQVEKKSDNGNPYLALSGLTQVRDVVVRSMTSQAVHAELCKPSQDPAYETMRSQLCGEDPRVVFDVGPDFTNSAPIILVKADADTAANARVALGAMMGQASTTLAGLQAPSKLDADSTIMSTALVTDTEPEVLHKDQIRLGIVAGGGILALGMLGLALLDSLLLGRSHRSEPADEVPDAAVDEPAAGWWGDDQDVALQDEVAALEQEATVAGWDVRREVERAGRQ